jgi:DNA-binding response OmpR family regulator
MAIAGGCMGSNPVKILIVEDDTNLGRTLRYNFLREGWQVVEATDGIRALEVARQERPSLVLLDLALPGRDGFDVCRLLRKESNVPIIMLTARESEIDKVVGLELGADDYITKPFSLRELLARIRANLRRSEGATSTPQNLEKITVDHIVIDPAMRQVVVHGQALPLKPKEFDLLLYLVQNRGRAIARDKLLQDVWGYDYAGETRTVDVHIHRLREKIEPDPTRPVYVLTIRGAGYSFRP